MMAKRIRAATLAVVVWAFAMPTGAIGQAATAAISGIVVDQTDAIVRDATIQQVNLGTGLQRMATVGTRGTLTVTLLPPGEYRLSAQRDRFIPAEIARIVLNVGDALDIRLMLKVAQVGESLTVTAEPARVSMLPSVGTVVDRQLVANLPLNGRSFQPLIAMTPGVG